MDNLKKRTFTALVWDVGGTFIKQGSTFIITIFLARMLGPEAYGLIGMAMVFITLIEVFVDTGFSSALIQNQTNTPLTYSSVFYFNLVAGIILTVAFYFCAPIIGWFYERDEITNLVRWLSIIFLFNSGNLVQLTILKKNLDFKTITIRTSISALIGGFAGISAAYFGLGVYSLVIQQIVMAVLGTFLLWKISNWRPNLEFSFSELRRLSGFSLFIFFDRLLTDISKKMDILFVGKVFDPTTLGLYSRAASLKDLVGKYTTTSVIKVLYPVLSEVQHDDKRFRAIYYKLTSTLAFFSFGLTGVLFIFGRDIFMNLFGPEWEPSIEIFHIIIFSTVNYPLNALMVNAYLSKGKAKENFYLNVLRKTIRFAPIIFGLLFGLKHFMFALVGFNYLITFINVFHMTKELNLNALTHLRKLFDAMFPLLLLVIVYFYFDFDSYGFGNRFILFLGFGITYIGFNFLIKNEGLNFTIQNVRVLIQRKIK